MGFPKGFKNAKIAVWEHLELKIFFAAQPWWVAFQQTVIDLQNIQIYIFCLFHPLKDLTGCFQRKQRSIWQDMITLLHVIFKSDTC